MTQCMTADLVVGTPPHMAEAAAAAANSPLSIEESIIE